MRQLDIVFTKSKKRCAIISKLIMWWTKKDYSHVSRGLEIKDWGHGYYQASEGRVNYEHESVFKKKHEVIKKYSLQVPDNVYNEIGKACWQEAGKPYATMQNVGILMVDILRYFGIKTKNPFTRGRNCSELLYVKVFKILHPELEYSPQTIKPHQIEEILTTKYKESLVFSKGANNEREV